MHLSNINSPFPNIYEKKSGSEMNSASFSQLRQEATERVTLKAGDNKEREREAEHPFP